MGGTKIEAVALADDGSLIARRRVPTPTSNYSATLHAVVELVCGIEKTVDRRCSVGVGTPGAVSPDTGLIKNANSTHLIGHPLARDLSEALEREVRIANDADCFALSEATDGAAAGACVVFGVIVGTGTGGGVVVGGRLVTGPNAIAGEWGHNPLPWPEPDEWPGPRCYCGRTGCIETFLSGPGFENHFERVNGESRTAAEIALGAEHGDARCLAAMACYEQRMARALAHVVNLLDPDVIVLGGGMSNMSRLYENVPRLWSAYVFSDVVNTRLMPPAHGDSSGVRGAAWLWPSAQAGGRGPV